MICFGFGSVYTYWYRDVETDWEWKEGAPNSDVIVEQSWQGLFLSEVTIPSSRKTCFGVLGVKPLRFIFQWRLTLLDSIWSVTSQCIVCVSICVETPSATICGIGAVIHPGKKNIATIFLLLFGNSSFRLCSFFGTLFLVPHLFPPSPDLVCFRTSRS
mgnify:CR=1 FL=1